MKRAGTALHTVLWDLDGTLVDTEQAWRRAESAFLTARGHRWNAADDNYIARLHGSSLDVVSDVFYEASGVRYPVDVLRREMTEAVRDEFSRGMPFMPGVRQLTAILAAAGVRQGIVTSSHDEVAADIVHALPVIDRQLVVTRDDVRNPKPAPEPYLTALARIDGGRDGVIAIEDSQTGVASATTAGLRVLAVGPHVQAGYLGSAPASTLVGVELADLVRVLNE